VEVLSPGMTNERRDREFKLSNIICLFGCYRPGKEDDLFSPRPPGRTRFHAY
jgi:hypothetical protein